jgi:hypothetical protein
MSQRQDDELIQLWLHSTSPEPDPSEIARLAGRASVKRFDQAILLRNFGQYVTALAALAVLVVNLRLSASLIFTLLAIVSVLIVCVYVWWQHRDLGPLDPTADSRAYHAAMLTRIDKQIRLLASYRFSYLMPISLPFIWGIFEGDDFALSWNLLMLIILFAGAAWLSESWGIRRLRAERAAIESLYEE